MIKDISYAKLILYHRYKLNLITGRKRNRFCRWSRGGGNGVRTGGSGGKGGQRQVELKGLELRAAEPGTPAGHLIPPNQASSATTMCHPVKLLGFCGNLQTV